MKVRMKIQLTGTRDGVAWPEPGGTVDLPEHEAAKLCDAGYAEPVAETSRERAEKRPAQGAEVRKQAARSRKGKS